MFYYLEAIDEVLQNHKLSRGLSSSVASLSSSTASVPATSPIFNTILNIASKAQPQPKRGLSVEISLSAELEMKSGEEALAYLLEQVSESAKTIQKCADHQKCMTDDVLQLSRLRSNKLTMNHTFYRPYDTMNTAVTIFKPQADTKVPSNLHPLRSFSFSYLYLLHPSFD